MGPHLTPMGPHPAPMWICTAVGENQWDPTAPLPTLRCPPLTLRCVAGRLTAAPRLASTRLPYLAGGLFSEPLYPFILLEFSLLQPLAMPYPRRGSNCDESVFFTKKGRPATTAPAPAALSNCYTNGALTRRMPPPPLKDQLSSPFGDRVKGVSLPAGTLYCQVDHRRKDGAVQLGKGEVTYGVPERVKADLVGLSEVT